MTKITAFIFDMDGVLLDSERLIRDVVLRISSDLGFPISDEVYLSCVGRNIQDTRRILAEQVSPIYPHTEVEQRVDSELAAIIRQDGWPLRPKVVAALEKVVSCGLPRCVATSTERQRADARLRSARLLHYFEHISGGDEVTRGKPAPDIFLLAAERLAVSPANCVVIEDSEYGAQAALEAGMQCLMVPDLKLPPDSIRSKVWGVYEDILSAVQAVVP